MVYFNFIENHRAIFKFMGIERHSNNGTHPDTYAFRMRLMFAMNDQLVKLSFERENDTRLNAELNKQTHTNTVPISLVFFSFSASIIYFNLGFSWSNSIFVCV